MITFFVSGRPVPKGSKNAFVNPKSGRAIMFDQKSKSLKKWEKSVRTMAMLHYQQQPRDEAIVVGLRFSFVRPRTHTLKSGELSAEGRRRPFMTVKPDVDKLARAVLDGLSKVVFVDDSQVVEVNARKVYDSIEGCQVTISTLAELEKTPTLVSESA